MSYLLLDKVIGAVEELYQSFHNERRSNDISVINDKIAVAVARVLAEHPFHQSVIKRF